MNPFLKSILGLKLSFSEGISVEKKMGVNWTNPNPFDTWGAVQVFNSKLWRAHVRTWVWEFIKREL